MKYALHARENLTVDVVTQHLLTWEMEHNVSPNPVSSNPYNVSPVPAANNPYRGPMQLANPMQVMQSTNMQQKEKTQSQQKDGATEECSCQCKCPNRTGPI